MRSLCVAICIPVALACSGCKPRPSDIVRENNIYFSGRDRSKPAPFKSEKVYLAAVEAFQIPLLGKSNEEIIKLFGPPSQIRKGIDQGSSIIRYAYGHDEFIVCELLFQYGKVQKVTLEQGYFQQ
jgi:hypothetical protein